MKLFKKITASILACTLLMGSVSMIASAQISGFWTYYQSELHTSIKNRTSTSRYMTVGVKVKRKDGSLLSSQGTSGVGKPYDGLVFYTYYGIYSTNYNYYTVGAIYNSSSYYSGISTTYSQLTTPPPRK